MGDPRRFQVMADAVERRWPDRTLKIADVAAGKGYLKAALYQRGYRNVVCIDKRPKKAPRRYYRYGHLSTNERERFDLILGMHPDEATDVVIAVAARQRVPFAVVPCCVKPTAWPYTGAMAGRDYAEWVEHLARRASELGAEVEGQDLRISGRSLMLVGAWR